MIVRPITDNLLPALGNCFDLRFLTLQLASKEEHDELVGSRKKQQDTARQSNDLAAKQAGYRRLKNIENQLVANDAEYKELLRNSSDVKKVVKELAELRSGQQRQEEAAQNLSTLSSSLKQSSKCCI